VTAPRPTPPRTVVVLDRTVDAPRAARMHVRRAAAEAALGDARAEEAVLLISELITNAVKYGGEARSSS
jgi:anti-sigma regulatory factor (Ser/Thr protein kinase)